MDSGAISWDHITLHLWKGKLGEQEEKQEEAESEQCYRRHSKMVEDLRHISKEDIQVAMKHIQRCAISLILCCCSVAKSYANY